MKSDIFKFAMALIFILATTPQVFLEFKENGCTLIALIVICAVYIAVAFEVLQRVLKFNFKPWE
ncbi:TPA: hypothetical protein ACX6PV_003956 [Photobacterium damselae]